MEVNKTLLHIHITVFGLSQGKVLFSTLSEKGFCSCDRRCRILGDCCADAPRECFGAENDEVLNLLPNDGYVEFESIRLNAAQRRIKTVYIDSDPVPYDVYYSFVKNCPSSGPYRQKCLFHTLHESVAHYTPVCHPNSGVLFANWFCAACNGYRVEDTFSFYIHVELCDRWMALSHTVDDLFENSTGVDDLLYLCHHYSNLEIPKACYATIERRRIYETKGKENSVKNLLCTSFVNPVVTKNYLGHTAIMKNQFCLQNTSISWHCYDGKVRPNTGAVKNSNETAVLWVNKLGDAVASPLNSGYDDTAASMGGTSWFHSCATIPITVFIFVFRCS